MARGKNQTRATGRRSAAQQALTAQLKDELELESQLLADANDVLAHVAELQRDLQSEGTALAEDVKPLVEQLRYERGRLRGLYADARAHNARVHESWNKYSGACIDRAPGAAQTEKIEAFGRAVGLVGWLTPSATEGLSAEQITRIQRARGERRGGVGSDA
jgi:hypothetical protein